MKRMRETDRRDEGRKRPTERKTKRDRQRQRNVCFWRLKETVRDRKRLLFSERERERERDREGEFERR